MLGADEMVIRKNISVTERRSRPYTQHLEGETEVQRGEGRGGDLAWCVPIAAPTALASLRVSPKTGPGEAKLAQTQEEEEEVAVAW